MSAAALHRNVEVVAERACDVCDMVREEDGAAVLATLTRLCEKNPGKAAQTMMALAAWVDVDEPLSVRSARVNAITAPRVGGIKC